MSECTKHCLHHSGRSTTMGFTDGVDEFTCCNCGANVSIRWTYRREPVPGHGPYFTTGRKVFEGE